MSESPSASQVPLLQSETGIMRRGSAMDNLDNSNHHIVSTENSVVSAESSLTAKKLSSSASSISATSSSGLSSNVNEKKEQIDAPQTQDDKARAPIVLQMNAPPHPVAEFLFQLTKMLTDDNKEYIEWRKGSIFVTDPPGLEKFILPKYFRHSNYSSFQRQMNYFGFRKIAGKGKMAPCSYVNENAKEDISSLLFIKRKKTGVSNKAATVVAQHANQIGGMNSFMMGGSGLMGGMSHPSLLSLNGCLQGIGGGLNHPGMSSQMQNSAFNEAALYREQQQMLAQLQHAHASATNDSSLSGATQNGLGVHQSKANSSFGSNIFNSGLQTTDNGNLYKPNTSNSDWHTQYPSSFDTQAHQMNANAAQGNTMGIDSSANFRALLNQQISLFNNSDSTGGPGAFPQNMNQGFTMPPTMQDNEMPITNVFNDQVAATHASSNDNDALIRQLEQQLFEAQAMNGMGGLMGMPRGSGN